MSATVNSLNIVNKAKEFDVEDRARDLLCPPRQRRYTMTTVRQARELYGDGTGWTPTQIRNYLARTQGIEVHVNTIRFWVVPGADDVQREMNRASYYRRQNRQPDPRTDPAELARRLRAEGQPLEGIVRVCRVLFGGRWTRGMVERLLAEGES